MILKLEISHNYLTAYLSAVEEENLEEQNPVTREDIETLLVENKISFGIKEDETNKLVGSKETTRDVVIAEGIPPEPGKSAEVQLIKKSRKLDEISPKANEDGDIDYVSPREGWLVPVKVGEELAVKIAPTQGKAGTNIYNAEIPGLWGNDFNLDNLGGINTEVDGIHLIATSDGFLSTYASKITVEPVYRIYDDIGPATGSIDIPKDYKAELHISKDIKTGFSVKVHKIIVAGCIEDAEIDVNELEVTQGIVGVSGIPINAKKAEVGYINGSRKIYSDGLKVNREISSGAQIFCSQVKANTIQGSTITASEAIWTNHVNGQNKLIVGIDYRSKQIMERCTTELNHMEEPLEQLQKVWRNSEKRMLYLKELSKKNPKHPIIAKELPQIKELKEKYTYYLEKKKSLEEERQKAIENRYPSSKPFLLVRDGFSRDTSSGSVVEPDTVINFREEIRKIMEPLNRLLMTVVKDQVVSSDKYNLKELKVRLNKINF